MKFTKYIAASMIAVASLTSCGESFLETEYTNYLDEEAAAEAEIPHPEPHPGGCNPCAGIPVPHRNACRRLQGRYEFHLLAADPGHRLSGGAHV